MNKNKLFTSHFSLLAFLLLFISCGCSKDNKKVVENPTPQPPTEKNRPMEFASDEAFLDYIQRAHLNYMWEGAEPNSGLAPERNHIDVPSDDAHIITTGGSGFGIAGLLVGVERGFIPRAQAVERFTKIVTFLEKADR